MLDCLGTEASTMVRKTSFWPAAMSVVSAFAMAASPVAAQVRSVDPDRGIDGDLSGARSAPMATPAPVAPASPADPVTTSPYGSAPAYQAPAPQASTFRSSTVRAAQQNGT